MPAIRRCALRACLELLELRDVPVGNLPWPVSPAPGGALDLSAVYGQFVNTPVLEFHEGIDIPVAAGTHVTAVQPGTVRFLQASAPPSYDDNMEINSDPSTPGYGFGWDYIHMTPGINSWYNRPFQRGDQVSGYAPPFPDNTDIGTVVAAPPIVTATGYPTHLHLGYGEGDDPEFPGTFRPTKDPLDLLSARPDTTAPTVSEIKFRRADDDWSDLSPGETTNSGNLINQEETRTNQHRYFTNQTPKNHFPIVGARARTASGTANSDGSPDIDIIARAYDQMAAGGNLVGLKSIGFGIIGQKLGKSASVPHSFDFTGEFVPDVRNGGVQTYESLRDAALVRTVYENDAQSPSLTTGGAYYTVTNTDGQSTLVRKENRLGMAWRTMKRADEPWNANEFAPVALSNIRANFPDDYYDIAVTATDEAGNSATKTVTVSLLDNWLQVLGAQLLPAQPGDPPGLIRVHFTGSNWTANAPVPVYWADALYLQEEEPISSAGSLLTTLYTDDDGNIIPTDFAFTPWDTSDPWEFVADYAGGDDIYQPQFDAFTLPTLMISPPPGGMTALSIAAPTDAGGSGGGAAQPTYSPPPPSGPAGAAPTLSLDDSPPIRPVTSDPTPPVPAAPSAVPPPSPGFPPDRWDW